MKLSGIESDSIGALAGTLCLIHCAITPFVFVAHTCTKACCTSAPDWWKWIDFVFIFIALFAVYRSTKSTRKTWMKVALWFTWVLLFLMIINDQIGLITLPEATVQVFALVLIGLHIYNLKKLSL